MGIMNSCRDICHLIQQDLLSIVDISIIIIDIDSICDQKPDVAKEIARKLKEIPEIINTSKRSVEEICELKTEAVWRRTRLALFVKGENQISLDLSAKIKELSCLDPAILRIINESPIEISIENGQSLAKKRF
ncbi:MAG: hypothetical protein EI684_08405 [Candidatus Viridilinea halotolerans]|uniref:Uncharacterized protein n=1 Tax=Candidatus Viridilinea halotolerans TaxID=2491704 RepID=A0A426U275_9CHLR|nr:MAG: hypothetical protein EI684_08405 [Candidatus Viridilinea halotolerans]